MQLCNVFPPLVFLEDSADGVLWTESRRFVGAILIVTAFFGSVLLVMLCLRKGIQIIYCSVSHLIWSVNSSLQRWNEMIEVCLRSFILKSLDFLPHCLFLFLYLTQLNTSKLAEWNRLSASHKPLSHAPLLTFLIGNDVEQKDQCLIYSRIQTQLMHLLEMEVSYSVSSLLTGNQNAGNTQGTGGFLVLFFFPLFSEKFH